MNGSVWNEDMVREELKRIDKKHDTNLAALPIRWIKSKSVLGRCCIGSDKNVGWFEFSVYYFHDTNFPDEEKADTVRHEAAHALDWLYYGNMGHRATWKKCCGMVGAYPNARVNVERVKYFRARHEQHEAESEMCDTFACGTEILHPKYGKGVITSIDGENEKRTLNIEFADIGAKKLSAVWVFVNCKFA